MDSVFLGRCPRLAWVAPLAHGGAQQRDFLTRLHQTVFLESAPSPSESMKEE